MSRPSSAGIIYRLIGGCVKPWCAATALESGEMIMHQPAVTDYACGLRVSRAVHEDCRGSIAIIRGLATAAGADGPGRPSRRVRILAPIPGQGWWHAGRCGGTGGAVRGRVGGSEDG